MQRQRMDADKEKLPGFLKEMGYPYKEVTKNPSYTFFSRD